MSWQFERVAGPFSGVLGGLAWDGKAMLFAAVTEERLMRFDPASGKTEELRKYTGRVNGLGFGPGGELYGCQEGGRRVIQIILSDGSSTPMPQVIGGRYHNHPSDLAVDSQGRIWFCDPYSAQLAFGPQIFPPLDHASVLRHERNERREWAMKRITDDTTAPRALALSPDEHTLYLAEGEVGRKGPRELRAYPIREDGSVGRYVVLHSFGADHRGEHRGIEGMCLDSEGNIVACSGSRQSGPGPLVSVFAPSGVILESHALPGDLPVRCAFGDADLSSLYVSTAEGNLYRAKAIGRRGLQRTK